MQVPRGNGAPGRWEGGLSWLSSDSTHQRLGQKGMKNTFKSKDMVGWRVSEIVQDSKRDSEEKGQAEGSQGLGAGMGMVERQEIGRENKRE